MESKVPQLIAVSAGSSASSVEDVFDVKRREKSDADANAERQKKETNEGKGFFSSIGDRLVSFYDSSFLAVQPPTKSWSPKLDVSAAFLSNPLFMCSYVDDKVCGYVDDRVEQKEPQKSQPLQHTVEKQPNLNQELPDARRTSAYVKSTDQLLDEICETTVANARKEFLTRESLEDAIKMNAEAAAAGDEHAEGELRRLFPLRFVLPTIAEMNEMIEALRKKKTNRMKKVNMAEAYKVQAEIDELEYQVRKEELYIRRRLISQTECVACGQEFSIQEVRTGQMLHCKDCRQVFNNDDASEAFTLTHSPLKSSLSIKVTRRGNESTPNDDDLISALS